MQGGNLAQGGRWQGAALTNSWEWFGAEHAKPAYRKGLDGRVYLRGELKKATGAASTSIFLLPAGYRPVAKTINAVWSMNGTVRVDVLPSGEVLYLGSSSAVSDLSLDQISFYPN